jgi:hypothetical protein
MAKANKSIAQPNLITAAASLYYGHEQEVPALLNLDAAIMKRLADGADPPRTGPWKPFCDAIRDDCGRSYDDRHIKRRVSKLKLSASA